MNMILLPEETSLTFWTRIWYQSCDRLTMILEDANTSEDELEIEEIINKLYEHKVMKAHQLKYTFNVPIGNICDN